MGGYDDSYSTNRVGLARGGAAALSVLGWDSDLVDKADLLTRLEWDPLFASGCTQAQAEAGLSVNAGDLEFSSAAAITAGADADFKARWWLTGFMLPGSAMDARCERLVIPVSSAAPLSFWKWGERHFANSAAASPSTPGDFGTYTDSFLGHWLQSQSTSNRIVSRLWGTQGQQNYGEFIRTHHHVIRRAECGGLNQYATVARGGVDYATTTVSFTQLDSTRGAGFSEFDPTRRVRMCLECDPAAGAAMGAGGNQEIKVRMPRITLDVLNP